VILEVQMLLLLMWSEIIIFIGNGVSNEDYVRWILDDGSSSLDCTSSPMVHFDVTNGTSDSIQNISANSTSESVPSVYVKEFLVKEHDDGYYFTTFNFNATYEGLSPVLCYKFADEGWQLYSDITIDIANLKNTSVQSGDLHVSVAVYPKTHEFQGYFVAKGDYAKWVEYDDASSCDDEVLLVDSTNGTNAKMIQSSHTAEFTFKTHEIGKIAYLCYKFQSEPYRLYSFAYTEIRGVESVTVEEGLRYLALPMTAKIFYFNGDGVQSDDLVKWVDSSGSCDDDGVETRASGTSPLSVESLSSGVTTASNVQFKLETVGGPYVLCYKFENEPFMQYSDFYLLIQGVLDLDVEVGFTDTIVVGLEKYFYFSAPKVMSSDYLRFVSMEATSDADCMDEDYQTGPYDKVSASSDGTRGEVALTVSGNDNAGITWKLCYIFNTEGAKLYPNTTLTSRALFEIQSKWGLSGVGVLNTPKDFVMVGEGISNYDTARWVPSIYVLNSDCDIWTYTESSVYATNRTTFVFNNSVSSTFSLCYRFEEEGWKIYNGISLTVYSISSTNTHKLIEWTPQILTFSGKGVTDGDLAKFVFYGDSCDADPAGNSSAEVIFATRATFTVSIEVTNLVLCYKFGSEPYTQFESVYLDVIPPEISMIDDASTVVGQETTLTLTGTFGFTSDDSLKWVENSAGDCTGDGLGGVNEITPTPLLGGQDTTGTSVFTATYTQPSAESVAWKLCYRFGELGEYLLFGKIDLIVAQVIAVSADMDTLSIAGSEVEFYFEGYGLEDGDLAKFVSSSVASDDDCTDASPEGGSEEVTLSGGIGLFQFTSAVSELLLCYKFGDNPYRYYGNEIAVTSTSEATTTTSASLMVQAEVSLELEGDLSAYPEGSAARTAFIEQFEEDVTTALDVPPDRIEVYNLLSGSIIVEFYVYPSSSNADPLVYELVEEIITQASNPNSTLMMGAVTSATTSVSYSLTETDDPTETVQSTITIVEYQSKGLFELESSAYYITENSGSLDINVIRTQGTAGSIMIYYVTSDGTAKVGLDYTSTSGTLSFGYGETIKTISIPILDDDIPEKHYETFYLDLSIPEIEGAYVGVTSSCTIYVYDYGEGVPLESTSFSLSSDLLGWSVIENGNKAGSMWIDHNGLGSSDQLFGPDEYNQECDYASPTEPCDFSCAYGGGYGTTNPETGESNGVLSLTSSASVVAWEPLTDFPSTELSFSMWIKSSELGQGGTLASYALPGTDSLVYELLVYDHRSISFMLDCQVIPAELRYDGFQNVDRVGLKTGINVADSQWHHIAITWRSSDGRVNAYLDGVREYEGGPYKQGSVLQSGGSFVVGQMLDTACKWEHSGQVPTCAFFDGKGLVASIQNVKLWAKELTGDEVFEEMQWPFPGSSISLVLYWRFEPENLEEQYIVIDSSGTGDSFTEGGNKGYLSSNATIIQDTPSVHPYYPCGEVYYNTWYFQASSNMTSALESAYGGRLQFGMKSPSQNGDARAKRGTVVILSSDGSEISHSAVFEYPNQHSSSTAYMSIILREDFSWVLEPLGTELSSQEMQSILRNASALFIRGDNWVYGQGGYGQEIVYINDITLYQKL